jgi:outer membrane protein assembly factor BamE (lipoprotein component of BamABCDE complex)
MTRRIPFLVAMASGLALLAGCAGVRDHRGYVLDQTLAKGIQPGVDNRDSVQKTLGRPTFTGTFADSDWYYVSRDTQQLAFRSPHVAKQTVLHVSFDRAGNVAAVNTTGKEQIASIRPYGPSTPTLGRKRSFFDEIFGNIGVVGAGGMGQGSSGQGK